MGEFPASVPFDHFPDVPAGHVGLSTAERGQTGFEAHHGAKGARPGTTVEEPGPGVEREGVGDPIVEKGQDDRDVVAARGQWGATTTCSPGSRWRRRRDGSRRGHGAALSDCGAHCVPAAPKGGTSPRNLSQSHQPLSSRRTSIPDAEPHRPRPPRRPSSPVRARTSMAHLPEPLHHAPARDLIAAEMTGRIEMDDSEHSQNRPPLKAT